MNSLRTSAFFIASAAAHLAVGALLFRPAAPLRAEAPTSATLTGESLSLPADLLADEVEAPSPDAPSPTPPAEGPAPTVHASRISPHTGSASSPEPTTYGAAGDRGATDLSSTFTRAFPQAASADPVWLAVPFGRVGSAKVSLEIDESGAFVQAQIDPHAAPALRRAIERTIALIRGRTFTAHARITPLYLSATVSPDDVHDGLHGDVFAIGGSFEGRRGNAFFALAAGRRIDLAIRGGK
jgi:hypothetical protein